MAVRNILHRSKLDEFKEWLGNRALPPVGKWELVRWKGGAGQPMRIVFDNLKSCEHLSCNGAAYRDVRAFIKERKISEDSCTQPTASNIDYTAALENELYRLYEQEFVDIDEDNINEVATRLNSVVKAQQNCA